MNAHTTINTALALRGSLPLDGHCVCACCDSKGLHRDDMASGWGISGEVVDRLTDQHNSEPCGECADSHTICNSCDAVVSRDALSEHYDESVCIGCCAVQAGRSAAEARDEMRRDV